MDIYGTLTALRKLKQDDVKLKNVHDELATSKDIIVFEDVLYYKETLDYTSNKSNTCLFNNFSYIVIFNNNIKYITSWDNDFELFKYIKRISKVISIKKVKLCNTL
ncbi:MAG: hypothetical protein FWE58_00900 [Methanobrevibacter sp.]|nr:hypothetical protein [Methanobrevibacter sp.]